LLTKLNSSGETSKDTTGVPLRVIGTPGNPNITADVGGIVQKKKKSIAAFFDKKIARAASVWLFVASATGRLGSNAVRGDRSAGNITYPRTGLRRSLEDFAFPRSVFERSVYRELAICA
jgi:hypothetical protein